MSSWKGRYEYQETPIQSTAGYSMMMLWDLIIFEDSGSYKGSLGIAGQQTDVLYHGDIVGNDDEVSYIYRKTSLGAGAPYKPGDTLLTIKNVKGELVTYWHKAQPILPEKFPASCKCFVKTNRNTGPDQ